MSLHIAKLFTRPLALASAALVIHFNAAAAADLTNDPQQQARDLLAGTTKPYYVLQPGEGDGQVTRPTVDAQELARRMLSGGTAGSHVGGAETIRHSESATASLKTGPQERAYGDGQEAARQMLLGHHAVSDSSRLTARTR